MQDIEQDPRGSQEDYWRVLRNLENELKENQAETANEERRSDEALEGSYTQGAAAVAATYLRRDAEVLEQAIEALKGGAKTNPTDPRCTQKTIENLVALLGPEKFETVKILLHPVTEAAAYKEIGALLAHFQGTLEQMPPSARTGLPAEDQIIASYRGMLLTTFIHPNPNWDKSRRLLYTKFREKGTTPEGAAQLVEETTKPRTMK